MKPPTLHTERLLLRRWTDDDREAFAQINADPEVMRYRFKPLTRQESDSLLDAIEACFDTNGFGRHTQPVIGQIVHRGRQCVAVLA